MLLVLTVREPRSGTAQDKALTVSLSAEANVTVLRPAALGPAACAELVRATLGDDPSAAFQDACRELTGGNPLLLRALLASLEAEGVRGRDTDVPHLRRLTPGMVSRSVLLQLGRMPAAALAAARAVAVLGTAASTARAARLAGLDGETCAEAIGALMAERLIEGEHALRFVHPLVRSAVYEDLAPPVRQRWHQRAARMLDGEGAPQEEVTVHLLAAAAAGDPWVVGKLRGAAADARRRGAPDVAALCLQRVLAEPPPAAMRADVLLELGQVEAMQAPAGAVRNARKALTSMPRLMSASTAALPETISVLLFADCAAEARAAADTWLKLAQQQGSHPVAATATGLASLLSLYGGEVSEAVAFGQQGVAGTPNVWISTITSAFVVRALVERGELGEAHALQAALGLAGDLPPTWPHNLVRHARGCLHAAAGDHAAAAVGDLLAAGELAERWGIPNPAILPWRSSAALSLRALGDSPAATRLCAEEIEFARRWGAARALGIALHAAGVADGTGRGIEQLTEAVTVLRVAPAPLELARALVDLGAAHRRAGARTTAREILREGLDLAHAMGGLALSDRARRELVVAGGRPRRDATLGRDALTPGKLRVAQLAADGQTNRQIAQALFVTQRTVEIHLTSTYAKLQINSRSALPAALGGSRTADTQQKAP